MVISEELQIYLDVSRNAQQNFVAQMEVARRSGKKSNETALKRRISGEVTESVIRGHLLGHGVKVSKTQVLIIGVDKPIDLLSLKSSVDASKEQFRPEEVDTVLEITNTGVSDKSGTITAKLKKIKKVAENVRFCVIVLSERDRYTNTIAEQKLGTDFGCKVFTLLGRERYINPFDWSEKTITCEYNRKTSKGVSAIRETGDWNKVLDFLLCKKG